MGNFGGLLCLCCMASRNAYGAPICAGLTPLVDSTRWELLDC